MLQFVRALWLSRAAGGRDLTHAALVYRACRLRGYRAGELSRGQVSELLDLEFNETEAFLKNHGCGLGLSFEEYEEDSTRLREFLGTVSLVVSDTTPLNYLILIGHIDVLPKLFGSLFIPPAVVK